MSDTPFSGQDWLKAQQQYWETWLKLSRETLDVLSQSDKQDSHARLHNLSSALEEWWQVLKNSENSQQTHTFRKFIQQGRHYLQLNEAFIHALDNLADADPDSDDWVQVWETGFRDIQTRFANPLDAEKVGFRFWEQPLDNWQYLLDVISEMPKSLWFDFQQQNADSNNQLSAQLEQLLIAQGISYTQEWQIRVQQALQKRLAYQQAHLHYDAIFGRISERTLTLLREQVLHRIQNGELIDNLHDLYLLWIDCGEAAFAEIAITDEYSDVHSELINTLMACKQHEQTMLDDLFTMLNLPSRREVDTLHQRIQQMRREIHTLQQGHNQEEIAELWQAVAELRGKQR